MCFVRRSGGRIKARVVLFWGTGQGRGGCGWMTGAKNTRKSFLSAQPRRRIATPSPRSSGVLTSQQHTHNASPPPRRFFETDMSLALPVKRPPTAASSPAPPQHPSKQPRYRDKSQPNPNPTTTASTSLTPNPPLERGKSRSFRSTEATLVSI